MNAGGRSLRERDLWGTDEEMKVNASVSYLEFQRTVPT